MEYVVYGKTGLKVSRIGFGGIPIQRSDNENAKKALISALDNGINFIDSARGYTVSEEYIGNSLGIKRKEFVISTKSMASSFDSMSADIDKSLSLLKTDYIDIYQMHCVKDVDTLKKYMQPDSVFGALLQAKKQGKIRHIGITAHVLEVLTYTLDNYAELIDSFMYPYNIVETQGAEMFDRAHKLGIGTMAMKPFAGGNLTNIQLAIKFILSNPSIDITLCGIGDENEAKTDASVSATPLTSEELEECKMLIDKLGTEFCRRCNYCAPCSVGISIPNCFTLQNYLNNYNLASWAQGRYDNLPVKPSACIACGACESRCPYNLKIIDKLKSVVKDFERR